MGICIRNHSTACDVSLESHVECGNYCESCVHGDNLDKDVTFVPYEGFLLRGEVPGNEEYIPW